MKWEKMGTCRLTRDNGNSKSVPSCFCIRTYILNPENRFTFDKKLLAKIFKIHHIVVFNVHIVKNRRNRILSRLTIRVSDWMREKVRMEMKLKCKCGAVIPSYVYPSPFIDYLLFRGTISKVTHRNRSCNSPHAFLEHSFWQYLEKNSKSDHVIKGAILQKKSYFKNSV